MVLESLFSERCSCKNMFLLSIIVSFSCIFLAWIIFPEYSGVILPLLITVAMTPIIYNIFKKEEDVERKEAEGKIHESFAERHGRTLLLLSLFFLGVFLAVFFVSLLVPEAEAARIFSSQLDAISAVKSAATAPAAVAAIAENILEKIILNNLKVMLFSFALSFIFGTGALWILSWNASVLAVYLASFAKKGLLASLYATTGIFPHTLIEVLAYFLAGIAGGILSVGIIREKIKSKEFLLVFKDSLLMLAIAVLAVLAGAVVEVWL